jgi:hypothetical protein
LNHQKRSVIAMEQVITGYLKSAEIGRKQSHKNLAVYPLLSGVNSTLDYVTLDEALSLDLVEISEVDLGGSVPELKFTNKSAGRVLILDGEEIVGAKQNRIVNTTILVEANTVTVIPVSCVEAGRWSYKTDRFQSEERVLSAGMRAMKAGHIHEAVRSSRKFRSDQGALWDEIEATARRRGAVSPSMAMSEIYEKERPSLEEYVNRFHPVDGQVGAFFLINGKVAGLDGFGKPDTFARVFKKLLASYALDAIDWFDSGKKYTVQRGGAFGFLEECLGCDIEQYPSVSLGTDCRLASKKVTGFALLMDEQVVHLSVFRRSKGRDGAGIDPGMRRFSARRRSRL